jgi:predicted MFS family arabinose efflux permease
MVLSCVLQVGTCILTAFAENVGVFIAAQILHGIGGSWFSTASVALIVEDPSGERIGRLLGILYSGVAWGSIVGTAAGGVLYDEIGQKSVFVGISVLIAMLGICMEKILKSETTLTNIPRPNLIFRLLRHPEIFRSLYLIAISNFTLGAFLVLFPAFLTDNFNWNSSDIGFAMIGGPIVYILFSYTIDRLMLLVDKSWLARVQVLLSSGCFWLLLSTSIIQKIPAVIALFTILYSVTSLVQIPQPGVVASVLNRSGLDIPLTAGAALVDVAIGAGYTSMVLTAWVKAASGFHGVFIYVAALISSAFLMTARSGNSALSE